MAAADRRHREIRASRRLQRRPDHRAARLAARARGLPAQSRGDGKGASLMGGQTTQQTQQQQQTQPWAPAAGTMQGILANVQGISPNLTGIEQGALSNLTALGAQGNRFAPQIGGVANSLL